MEFLPLPAAELRARGWTSDELANVETVVASYGLLSSGMVGETELARQYDAGYTDHASTVTGGDLKALAAFVNGFQSSFPDGAIHVQQILADGTSVFVHTRARRTPEQKWDTVMEVFRLQGGRIAEHWEAIEPWDFPQSTADSSSRTEVRA